MAKITKLESENRKRFLIEKTKELWPKGEMSHLIKPPSAAALNDILFKQFNEKMRTDMVYECRERAVQELQAEGMKVRELPRRSPVDSAPTSPPKWTAPPAVHSTPRPDPVHLVPALTMKPVAVVPQSALPHLVRGIDSQSADAVERVFTELRQHGITNLGVEARGHGYIVISTMP